MRLTVRLTRARGSGGREGASQSLQGLELETVTQPRGNFRGIKRGRAQGENIVSVRQRSGITAAGGGYIREAAGKRER